MDPLEPVWRGIADRGHGPSGRLRALGQSLMQYFCYSHLVDAATGEVEFAIWGCHHIANYAAAGGDRGRNSESPCFWVEAHESVWPETCFHVPHHTVRGGRDGVGFTVGTPGGTPLVDWCWNWRWKWRPAFCLAFVVLS